MFGYAFFARARVDDVAVSHIYCDMSDINSPAAKKFVRVVSLHAFKENKISCFEVARALDGAAAGGLEDGTARQINAR